MNLNTCKTTTQAALAACVLHAIPIPAGDLSLAETAFNAVDGDSRELMIAVGDRGAIMHISEGLQTRRVDSPTEADLVDVHVGSSDFAVTVGRGVVLLWDGARWQHLAERSGDAALGHGWASPDELLVLYTSGAGGRQVCPWIPDAPHQPFCRRFKAPMVGACGTHETVHLVLANGDIHQVNDALLGIDGQFAPVFQPEVPLELQTAWLPEEACGGRDELPRVYAVDVHGNLVQFNGEAWNSIDTSSLAVAILNTPLGGPRTRLAATHGLD